jgi:hypothetical protein
VASADRADLVVSAVPDVPAVQEAQVVSDAPGASADRAASVGRVVPGVPDAQVASTELADPAARAVSVAPHRGRLEEAAASRVRNVLAERLVI